MDEKQAKCSRTVYAGARQVPEAYTYGSRDFSEIENISPAPGPVKIRQKGQLPATGSLVVSL
jgi:hypothetical protein